MTEASPVALPPRKGTYRDLWGLTTTLRVALVIFAGLGALSLLSGFLDIVVLKKLAYGEAVSEGQVTAANLRRAIMWYLQLVTYIVIGLIFLRWIYFSKANAYAMSHGLRFKPGWAIGWFLIPVANLWKPYQAMEETFRASHPNFDADWPRAPRPSILPLWWTLWILDNVLGRFNSHLHAHSPLEQLHAAQIGVFQSLTIIPLGFVAMSMIGILYSWQSEKHRRMLPTQSP